ncbi:hypothetical protein H0H93_016844 [Arthromyces matolae]|nr:hypothetical protein H0H93_016844 [Arthromyces matolae]
MKPEPVIYFVGTGVTEGKHPVDYFPIERGRLQRDLHNYRGNGLVYILESDVSNDEWDSRTKEEIHDILHLSDISAVPILILALSQTGNQTVEDVARKFDLQGINLQVCILNGIDKPY